MDKGEEILSFYLDHNGGFLGSGSNAGSGNQGGRLQAPPGFKTPPNPNLSPHCHSNMRISPSLGSLLNHPTPPPGFRHGFNSGGGGGGGASDGVAVIRTIPDLSTGNGFIPKKKRGRPRKSPMLAVGTPVPTALTPQNKTTVGKPVPTALTPQNKTTVGKPVPTALTPLNVRDQNQKSVNENPDLSKLKPPSRSGGFKTGNELQELLKRASSVLISGIKEAANANEMIELASITFMYFNSLGVDYTPVHKAVCSVIRLHCQKEALAKQKPHSAFDTKRVHDQAVVEFFQAEGRRAGVNMELEDLQRDFDAITAHVKRLSEELKNANEKKAKLEAKLAGAQADKVSCDEAYSKAKSKMENIAPKMSEAQKAIDEFERRWKETMDGLNRAMEETSNIRI